MEPRDISQLKLHLPMWLRTRKIEWFHCAGASFILSLIAIAIHKIPLGHDESVYALRGHDLRTSSAYLSGDYWRDYRAPGLSFIDSWLFNIFGENDFVARLPSMFFGLLLLLVTYLLAKELFGNRIAQIASVLFVATPPLVLNSAYLLADIPGASVAISCVLMVFYLQRIKVNYYLVLTCIFVLGSISTILRFGSFITYGSGVFAASIYFLMVNRHEPKVAKRIFDQLTLQFVSLFSFGWIYFTHVTSINGKTPYEANSNFAAGAGVTPLNGLIDLLELTNPLSPIAIWIGSIVGFLTFSSYIFALGNIGTSSKLRFQTLSIVIAGMLSLTLLVVGVRYVQNNYLVLSAPYWVILSATGLDLAYKRHVKRYEVNLGLINKLKVTPIAVAILLICLPTYYFAESYMKVNTTRFGVRAAGEAIRTNTNYENCLVLSSYPQSAWYSKCLLGIWIGTTEDKPKLGVADSDFNRVVNSSIAAMNREKWKEMRNNQELVTYRKFVVLVTNGKRQPSDELIQADRITLLEKQFTTDRVFYAEVNSDSISAP